MFICFMPLWVWSWLHFVTIPRHARHKPLPSNVLILLGSVLGPLLFLNSHSSLCLPTNPVLPKPPKCVSLTQATSLDSETLYPHVQYQIVLNTSQGLLNQSFILLPSNMLLLLYNLSGWMTHPSKKSNSHTRLIFFLIPSITKPYWFGLLNIMNLSLHSTLTVSALV